MKFQLHTTKDEEAGGVLDFLCIALLLGSVWGFFEVFFKDVLNMGGKPFASATMTGIGMFLMAAGYGLSGKSRIFLATAVFTICARMIIVPVLGCSPICRANAVIALALLGASCSLVFSASSGFAGRRAGAGVLPAGASVFLSGLAFYPLGITCAPCRYLGNFAAAGGLTAFLKSEVIFWSLFAAVLYYPGFITGTLMKEWIASIRYRKPLAYYAGLFAGSIAMMLATGLMLLH
ncbi:MAG: hypothetical protein JW807_10280 [Spirochaetes bacterium]|nr:hypothetical protein [Spirochaetota bacterium]